ncbi:MAG TPA: adenosylcobinamide amidohydrolase [Acidimicrobiales bacterium]|nr:adenosylcobinamide amidohydrolase [Acidimicrobiales bacterium]
MAGSTPRQLITDVRPEAHEHVEDGEVLTMLVWRFAQPVLTVSSAPLGGGLGLRRWVVNAQVPYSFARLDPEAHLEELASHAGLVGDGVGMLTAVDLRRAIGASDDGARAEVSVGLAFPTWAAAPDEGSYILLAEADRVGPGAHGGAVPGSIPGTVNIVGVVPERLSPAALVNAVLTVTEAKAQALWEAGVAATGTASDAVCVACPAEGPEQPFGGPRSLWGARLARAVHRAVLDACRPGTAP